MNTAYVIKSLYYDRANGLYEVRSVLIFADNEDTALDKGQLDAQEYSQNLGYNYTGYSESSFPIDQTIEEETELYSVMRYPELSSKEYIKSSLNTCDEVNLKSD